MMCFVKLSIVYLVAESRPARKDYNKLRGDDNVTKGDKDTSTTTTTTNNTTATTEEHLDNAPNYTNVYGVNNEPQDTDTDSSFTDLELDDRDEFTDSDYGMVNK